MLQIHIYTIYIEQKNSTRASNNYVLINYSTLIITFVYIQCVCLEIKEISTYLEEKRLYV